MGKHDGAQQRGATLESQAIGTPQKEKNINRSTTTRSMIFSCVCLLVLSRMYITTQNLISSSPPLYVRCCCCDCDCDCCCAAPPVAPIPPRPLILMVKEHEGTAGDTSACTVDVMPRFSSAPLMSPQGKLSTVAAARRVACFSPKRGVVLRGGCHIDTNFGIVAYINEHHRVSFTSSSAVKGRSQRNLASRSTNTPWWRQHLEVLGVWLVRGSITNTMGQSVSFQNT